MMCGCHLLTISAISLFIKTSAISTSITVSSVLLSTVSKQQWHRCTSDNGQFLSYTWPLSVASLRALTIQHAQKENGRIPLLLLCYIKLSSLLP